MSETNVNTIWRPVVRPTEVPVPYPSSQPQQQQDTNCLFVDPQQQQLHYHQQQQQQQQQPHYTKTSLAHDNEPNNNLITTKQINQRILNASQLFNSTPKPFVKQASLAEISSLEREHQQRLTTRLLRQSNSLQIDDKQQATTNTTTNTTTEANAMSPKLVHNQYNSPIDLYSMSNIRKTIEAHSEMIAPGVKGINFMKADAPVNKQSEVLKLIKEEEEEEQRRRQQQQQQHKPLPSSNQPISLPYMSEPSKTFSNKQQQQQQHRLQYATEQVACGGESTNSASQGQQQQMRSILKQQGSSTMSSSSAQLASQRIAPSAGTNLQGAQPKCFECGQPIEGPFAKLQDRFIHPQCFNCSTCGTSLKNSGYFTINDKLYCDIHARQVTNVMRLNYNFEPNKQAVMSNQPEISEHHRTDPCTQQVLVEKKAPNQLQQTQIQQQQQQQQQQQLLTQNHQATPIINQQIQTVAHSTVVNQVTQSNAAPNHTNQVPLLNYNSYPSAPPFTNLPTLSVPQSAPQVAAYLGHQHQTNSIPSILSTNLDTIAQNTLSNSANNLHQNNVQQPRPLVTNTTLNGPLPNSVYRNAQQQTTEQQAPNVHQQQPSTPTPAQQLGQATRSISSDDTLNIINDQVQAMILNQLLATHQFSLPLVAPQLQSQQIAAPQQLVNTPRTQTTLPLSGQSPLVMTPAQQQATPTQIVPPQHQHQPSLEQASENQLQQQQQTFNHSTIQPRVNQAPQPPTSSTNETYLSSVNNAASGSYRSHPNNDPHNQRPPSNPVLQAHQGPQTLSQPPPPLQPQSHHHQPHTGLPPMPFYTYPQDGEIANQAMQLLQDPRVAQSVFGHLWTLLRNNVYRQESQHTNHHHVTPHFHHLHGAHHHHHGQNGQTNGQDASMPLDSLAINESKPRGLSRAEIDSLTPYIHTNEKDARTCVICLSKFELKSKIRPLPCNHAFHAKCVDKWLRTNRTCPICRRDALKTFNGKIKRI